MSAAADFSQDIEGDACHLRFTGRLTLARIGDLPQRLEDVRADRLVADLSRIERMDTPEKLAEYKAIVARSLAQIPSLGYTIPTGGGETAADTTTQL